MGSIFSSRKDLYEARLHNSYQKGIGKAKDGSGNMSIVLSGGYVDDEDYGDTIIYTGEGGRDPSTGKQITDQKIKGGNKDLIEAFESNSQVYVIRGHQHKSDFSPDEGYELAGKYFISEHWIEKGRDGFNIIRFKLVNDNFAISSDVNIEMPQGQRVEYTSARIIRETKIALEIKQLYSYRCQVCDEAISLPTSKKYAEAAHIKPLGRPHNGPDALSNLLCLCPNHHLMFDKYCYSINPETFELVGLKMYEELKVLHDIDKALLTYHWDNYLKHKTGLH